MAKITIEITDCIDGLVQTQLIADAEPPKDPSEHTPAQRLALKIRAALIGDTTCIGLDMTGDSYKCHEETSND